MRLHLLYFVIPAVLLGGLATGCRDREVTTYRVPKEKDAPLALPSSASANPAASQPAMANTPVATAEGPGLVWSAPPQWKPKSGSSLRKGSYAISGDGAEADLSITAFPGDVGGDLANVNRWRGQIQLPPIAESELGGTMTHLESNGLHFHVVDFANSQSANPQRIIGAIVPFKGATWFFKLIGPDALVAKEKPAFEAFLHSVRVTE